MDTRSVSLAVLIVAMAGLSRGAAAQGPRDAMVQAPTFKQPERGSLVGSLAKFSIGAEDVSRGSFDLALSIEVPSERGGLLAPVLPSYAPENGISEWGIGWSAGLAIQRFRLTGDVDYQTDGFTSPWGRLEQGTDGFYYPAGLKTAMRLEKQATGWVATDSSGSEYEFRRVVGTPEGAYAWYLTRVTTLFGDAADVQYQSSSAGRPFVTQVRYGGRESPQTYRLIFEYETLPVPLLDFRSGYPLLLDRRVTAVVAWAKEGGNGTYRRRWRYDITYRDSAFGPGFHLDSVMRTFVSGDSEPPILYDYDLPEQSTPAGLAFRTGDLETVPGVAAYLVATDDPDGIQPDHAAVTDIDDDGLPDLEHGSDFTLYRQSASGAFAAEPLGPPPGGVDPFCRPPDSIFNDARTLVRMAGAGTDLQVLALEPISSTTNIRVCNREGAVQFSVDVPGLWTLGANVKVVDLNRDDKPDLLQIDSGMYSVLENISGEGCGPEGGECVPFGFRAHAPVELSYVNGFPFTPSASWAQDMNGDGNPDLVQRTDDRMSIWYGRGRFGFDDTERQLAFLSRDGNEIFNLDEWEVSWVDVNKDGLADALMVFGREPTLFINEGDHFQEVLAPVLAETIFLGLGAPVVGDLRGHGDLDLNFITDTVRAIEVTTPSSGLLLDSDDGKGTVVSFGYERAEAAPGLRQRPSLLTSLTVETAGYDPVTFEYGYGAPTMHTVGHFLVGFGTVEVDGPQRRDEVAFYHDDQIAAQVETSFAFDERTPGLMKFALTSYEEALHAGVRVRRSQTTRSGWCGGTDAAACSAGTAPAVFETTDILVYERGICPTRVRTTNRQGQLVTEQVLASPAHLAGALHCVSSGQTWTGTHADPSRDFQLQSRLTRDDDGQVTRIDQIRGDESLTLQEIAYHPTTGRIASVSAPGQGVQTFTFDAATGQLTTATAVDGVVATAQSRSPTTDALLELVGDRGAGGVLVSSYRYDGMERLAKGWADFGGSSSAQPLETIDYQFPTTDFPGLVQVSSLVDAATQTRQQSASWIYPDGAQLTSATRIPGRWVFGATSSASRTALRTSTFRRTPLLEEAGVALQTYTSLLTGATQLGETTAAGFGHEVSSRAVVQQGVERRVASTLTLTNGLLVTSSRENDVFETQRAVDASDRVIWVRDQTGATTGYEYDALGRLVDVTLAGGTHHRLSFDAFGRPSQVARDGLGTISYFYLPTTGQLDHKEYRDADSDLERTVAFEYDAIGRVTGRVHVQPDTGDESRFTFRHDGDIGGGEILAGQRGHTTQVEGPAYTSTTVRNPDGSEATSSLVLADWMQIDVASTYHAGGAVKDRHRTVTRLSDGAIIDDVTLGHIHDAWGRLDRITLNGAVLATLHYDDDGRLAWVDLPDGQRIDHLYDPVTHRQTGYAQEMNGDAGPWLTGVEWTYNNRGLIASEAIDLGDQSWLRTYGHDPRGYLDRAEDADQLSTYTYTLAGLPDQITDERGSRTVFRGTARTITVAGISYTYDASGRVIARGPAAFIYGPDGNLAEAEIDERVLTYGYDADGNRILKSENGVPIAAYLGDDYLTDETLIAPIKIGGRIVGILESGTFHLLATDPRGTVLADRDGTPRLASPYGVRTTRPDLAAALDYVEKAYDVDIESVRMGVRDYDPLLGQFWTPDPLFLESLDKCAEAPVKCTLFTYASNDPLRNVDPDGLEDADREYREAWEASNEPPPRPLNALEQRVAGAGLLIGLFAGGVVGNVMVRLTGSALVGSTAGGAASGVVTTAVGDAVRGELSSPETYAASAGVGGAFGGLSFFLGRSGPSIGAPSAEARTAGQRLADRVQSLPASERPNTVAVLVAQDGRIVIGRNRGEVSNPEVQSALGRIPANEFGGACAEANCIARALNKGIDIRGAKIEVVNVRGAGSTTNIHGTPKPPCFVCIRLLEFFGVRP